MRRRFSWMIAAFFGAALCASGQNGRCGVADPAYIRAANETGGIPMFLDRSEAAKAFHLVRESTRNNVSKVLWASGDLDAQGQMHEIPVDSATRRITFAFSTGTKGSKLVLKQPSGQILSESFRDTEITELNCGRIITVGAPEPGSWLAEISGRGQYWISAEAQSDIFLVRAEFVKRGGRPGHEGLFPIPGQPVAGVPATLRVSFTAPDKLADFSLVNEHGRTIGKINMREIQSTSPFEFIGNGDLPAVPFRVAVTGRDSQGRVYQRFSARLFHAESVEISPKLDFDQLPAGSTKQAAFVIRNIGEPRSYRITVTDARHFVSSVEPNEISLGAGESGVIRVDLTAPPGTPPGSATDVVVVAAGVGEPRTSNSSVEHVSVAP